MDCCRHDGALFWFVPSWHAGCTGCGEGVIVNIERQLLKLLSSEATSEEVEGAGKGISYLDIRSTLLLLAVGIVDKRLIEVEP